MSNPHTVIHRPTQDFTFDKISISTNGKRTAGWYFAKIEHDMKPLCIEAPEVLSKAGLVKVSSQTVCDLMFSPEDEEEVLTWFELLVTRCHVLLSEHTSDWFTESFSVNDIEAVFDCPMKSYKSGRYQLCRCSVATTGDHPTTIYDESQNKIAIPDVIIDSTTRLVPIIEVSGISFTTSRFRLSLKIKQMMIVDDDEALVTESCMIQRSGRNNISSGKIPMDIRPSGVILSPSQELHTDDNMESDTTDIGSNVDDPSPINSELEPEPAPAPEPEPEPEPEPAPDPEPEPEPEPEPTTWDSLVSGGELVTIDPDVDINAPTIDLKDPIQVYQQRYGRAKKRAQQLKSDAIRAILEANSIKDAYSMLSYADSESDISDIELEIE